jgi:hypothetical protein
VNARTAAQYLLFTAVAGVAGILAVETRASSGVGGTIVLLIQRRLAPPG